MSALLLLPLGFSPALRPLPAAPACGLRSAAVPLARRGVAVAMDASDIDSLLEDVEVEADAEEVAAPAAAPPAEPSDPLGGLAEGSWEMTAEGGDASHATVRTTCAGSRRTRLRAPSRACPPIAHATAAARWPMHTRGTESGLPAAGRHGCERYGCGG